MLKFLPQIGFRNALSNLLMRSVPMMIQFFSVPAIVKNLGTERYGLLALYATLSGALVVIDQGVTLSVLREVGHKHGTARADEIGGLIKALSRISGATGIVVGLLLAASSAVLDLSLLAGGNLPVDRVAATLTVMGLTLMCQWSAGFYTAAFAALRQQYALLPLSLMHSIAMIAGTIFISYRFPSVPLILLWQASAWLTFVLLARSRLSLAMPGGGAPPNWRAVWQLRRFAAGTLAVAICSAVLTQADNILVARLTGLEPFASYALCFTLSALLLSLVAGPVSSVALPELSMLVHLRDTAGLERAHRHFTRVITVFAVPMAGILIFFPGQLLDLWLGSQSALLPGTRVWLPVVAAGSLLNAFATSLASLQYAAGWTRLSLYKNLVLAPIFLVCLSWLIPREGPIAGAYCWLGVNLLYCTMEAAIVYRVMFRPSALLGWFLDTFAAAGLGFLPFLLAWSLSRPAQPPLWLGVCAAAASFVLLLAVFPSLRSAFRQTEPAALA